MYRICTDVGGTFTDGVLLDETTGNIEVSKVSSTPHNPAIGTIESIEKFGVSLKEASFLAHGTTVVINALIEGKGAKTALITTEGFRDVLEIGRSNRIEMYNVLYKKPTSLVPRYLCLEVKERIASTGEVLEQLKVDTLTWIVELLKKEQVKSVGVCLINAYSNPVHEVKIGKFLQGHYPEATFSLSHNITRRYYEYERTSTTVQNAFVLPVVKSYLGSLEKELKDREFQGILQIMQSNGGIMTSEVAKELPIAMVESGPVAGAMGGAMLASMIGYDNVLTYDMGGTTAKTSIIRGGYPETANMYEVDGRPILLPVVDIKEIGAGGGSVAWIDGAGALHVGPHSAGAEPGPACYKRGGTEPTVTDADLQLGILDPHYFLGGKMDISAPHSREAIEKISNFFSISIDEAALGITKIVNNNMSGLLQSMTVKRGYDPREFAMVAFGGAGPIHAAAIAKELKIPTVIVPIYPGVFSAWGMLMADLRHDFTQTYIRMMNSADIRVINKIYRDLESQVYEVFQRENIGRENIIISYKMDLRYFGQEHTLSVTAPHDVREQDKEALSKSFDDLHLRIYAHHAPEEPKEMVSLSVIGIGKMKRPELKAIPEGNKTPSAESRMGNRKVYLGDGVYQEFSIFKRDKLKAGNTLLGPVIIEEPTSTTVVEKEQTCTVDTYGNLIITLNKEHAQ